MEYHNFKRSSGEHFADFTIYFKNNIQVGKTCGFTRCSKSALLIVLLTCMKKIRSLVEQFDRR